MTQSEFENELFDGFTHSNNIKVRLDFLNVLTYLNLYIEDPIDFLFNNLYLSPANTDKDKSEFFKYVKKKMDNDLTETLIDKLFNIFTDKICIDQKNCQVLPYQAFESYLKVFLENNQKKNLLKYNKLDRDNIFDITSYCSSPENLEGFDTLWRIIFESFSNEIMNKGIEILHDLYTVSIINR